MTKPSALDLIKTTEGHVTDEILERLGQELFEDVAQPPPAAAPPPPPAPQADQPELEEMSRADFLRYQALQEHNPEQFDRVRRQMVAWAANHPEDFRKWDTSHKHFLQAYDEFSRELTRAEYRAKFGKDVRFKEEVDAETAARRAAEEEYRMVEAEREADRQMREDLATAYRTRDWLTAERLEETMARRILGTEPKQQPTRRKDDAKPAPPEVGSSAWWAAISNAKSAR